MGLVGAAADDTGAATPLAPTAARLYQRGHDQGLGPLDDSALIQAPRPAARFCATPCPRPVGRRPVSRPAGVSTR